MEARLNGLLEMKEEQRISLDELAFALDDSVEYFVDTCVIPGESVFTTSAAADWVLAALSKGPSWVHCNLFVNADRGPIVSLRFSETEGIESPAINVSLEGKQVRTRG